jgi:hypothetical protein
MKRPAIIAALGFVVTALLCCTARAQTRTGSTMEIDAEVTDGAGDVVTSASYSMVTSVSQTQVGHVASASFKLDIGFIAAAPPNTGPGDLNGDGSVDWGDMTIIFANWGLQDAHAGWDRRADTDGDGWCNIVDLMAVSFNWGMDY